MAEIRKFGWLRHVRSDASSYIVHLRDDRILRQGRGLAFFFQPLSESLAEIPLDDRELTLVVHGRSADYQDVTVQGVLLWRASEPRLLSSRVDFSLDLNTGAHRAKPVEQVNALIARLAIEHGVAYLARTPLRKVLADGFETIRQTMEAGISGAGELANFGLEITSLRVVKIAPESGVAQAIEAPARERIKQEADEASFARRAMAVDAERAIAENELANRIELAKRQETLIAQEGTNAKRRAEDEAQTRAIASEAESKSIDVVESSRLAIERTRLGAYRELPGGVLALLAARDLGAKISNIENLNVTPELLGTLLATLGGVGLRGSGER
jgi:hypothetical protein